MRILWSVTKVVAAVFLAASSVIGIAGRLFDWRDSLDTVALFGWTWFDLLFVVLVISFWIVVINLYLRTHRLEKRQPKLTVLPIAYKGENCAYLEIHNKGGYAPSCIGNVTAVSVVTSVGDVEYLRNQIGILLWAGGERTMNLPNDGVRRRLVIAKSAPDGWVIPNIQKYGVGRYKVDVVVSFETETPYSRSVSIVLECNLVGKKLDYTQQNIGELKVSLWEGK